MRYDWIPCAVPVMDSLFPLIGGARWDNRLDLLSLERTDILAHSPMDAWPAITFCGEEGQRQTRLFWHRGEPCTRLRCLVGIGAQLSARPYLLVGPVIAHGRAFFANPAWTILFLNRHLKRYKAVAIVAIRVCWTLGISDFS